MSICSPRGQAHARIIGRTDADGSLERRDARSEDSGIRSVGRPATIGRCPPIDAVDRPTDVDSARSVDPRPDARHRHPDERRPRPDLPRDRRHARGQGRARLQDRRLSPGGRRHRPQPDRHPRGLPQRDDRPRIPGVGQAISDKIAEIVATGRSASTTASGPRSHRPSSSCSRSRAWGRARSGSSTTSSASTRSTTSARRPRPAGCATVKGLSARTEQSILEGIARLARPARPDAPRRGRGDRRPSSSPSSAARRASPRSSRPARSAAGARRSATSTCWPRPPTPRALVDRFTEPGVGRSGHQPRLLQGRRPRSSAGPRST